ncbi:hypothetical protein [Streptomyces poonensis]|uniref:Uncharacterized protein n=1 Tax=Streptomyces poonensis TaxID=68255 RepID=A0A918PSY7_9ACTN|nr:hypothetical protein [Streptomyces poonensis]GGZ20940.1 hypothetical protein GCM10010365_46600 [Streptomyces poonensis]
MLAEEFLNGVSQGYLAALGIEDIQACTDKPDVTNESCQAIALAAAAPLGRAKKLKDAIDAVDKAAQASKVFRPVVTFGDDYVEFLKKHRSGGERVDEYKGIFEGKYVKGEARLQARLQDAVNRGTPRRNWGTNPDGSKRDGWVYDWDFGEPNYVGKLSEYEVKKYGLTGDQTRTTMLRVILNEDGSLRTAHPLRKMGSEILPE